MKNKVEKSEIKRFVIVLIILTVIIGGIYFLTSLIVDEKPEQEAEAAIPGAVNYNVAIIGNMLTRPEEDYYVYVVDYESKNTEIYEAGTLINEYYSQTEEDLMKIYEVNLASSLNSSYKVKEDEETNPSAKTIEDFKFGDYTLIKIKNNKVVEYLDTIEEIEDELK